MQTRTTRRFVAIAIVVFCVLAWRPAETHYRAATLLTRFSSTEREHGESTVEETSLSIPSRGEPIRARLYAPKGMAPAHGMVLAHGVHHRGMDEPRLVRFAEAVARTGITVLTPEIRELCDYRIVPEATETIGLAAHALREKLGEPVGVAGFSFAGGLSLLAASSPGFASDIRFVVSIGGHDDLARVLRFFATASVAHADGSFTSMAPHDYGAMVLVYGRVESFFPSADVETARDALRLWLHEDFAHAREKAEPLSDESQQTIKRLFAHDIEGLKPALLRFIADHANELSRVSPHGQLAQLRVPVLLLHGQGDSVIPAAELEWLARDTHAATTLVSPVIEHVELRDKPGILDEFALVHFMAEVIAHAEPR